MNKIRQTLLIFSNVRCPTLANPRTTLQLPAMATDMEVKQTELETESK